MPKRCSRWVLVAVLGICAADGVGRAPPARAAAAAAKKAASHHSKPPARHGKRQARNLRPAHSGRTAHGKGRAKKRVFLERHVVAIKGGLPNVQALGALVIDGETGQELYSRYPDKERPIASISKLAATLVVMDKGLELEGLSTIAKADLEVARGGAKSRLLEGMTLSNRDLLHAALMGSDNRAIPALGRAVKLTPSQLAAAMTAKAKSLGLQNTRFRDPTGLSNDNVSTPRETIVMLRNVMGHPVLGPITRRLQYDAHPVGKPPITYNNTDKPAQRGNIQVLGGKTGYNDEARYCLVIAAKVEGRTYFMSFLSNEGKLTRFGDVARVADWIVSRRAQKSASTLLAGTGSASGTVLAASPPAPLPTPPAAPPPASPAGSGVIAAGPSESSPPPASSSATALPIGVAAPAAAAPETAVR